MLLVSKTLKRRKTDLCWGQTTGYFCLLKCSLCQIGRLKSHKLLPCCAWETWQTSRCSLIYHRLHFTTCVTSPARKGSPLTTITDRPSWEVNKNQTCCCCVSAVRSWGVLTVASVVVHYDALHETFDCRTWCSVIVSEATQSSMSIVGLISCTLTSTLNVLCFGLTH